MYNEHLLNSWQINHDPNILIEFIKKFRDNIWPYYSPSGHWTTEQEEGIAKFCNPPLDGMYHTTYYDGKILHCSVGEVEISFQKESASMCFYFPNISISIYSDYLYYGSETIYNDSYSDIRYNSPVKGFEELLNIREFDNERLVTVYIQLKGKINVN